MSTAALVKLFSPKNPLYRPFDMDAFIKKTAPTLDGAAFLKETAAAPSRSPNGYISNTYRYPCPFADHTLTAESNAEFGFLLTIPRQRGVLRVYEQARREVIHGKTKDGHPFCYSVVIDVTVIHDNGTVELIELMPDDDAAWESLKNPNRFKDVGNGEYVSEATAAHFARMGPNFKHRIVLTRNLCPSYVQWADFLRPYCLGQSLQPITEEEANQVIAAVHEEPGIFMEDLEITPHSRKAEIVYHMLGKGEIFTHFSVGHPTKQHEIRLYPTALHEEAFDLLRQTARVAPENLNDLKYRIVVGTLIEIKGREFTVARKWASHLTLQNAKTGAEKKVSFQALLDMKPLIGKIYFAEKLFEAKLQEASAEELLTILSRHTTIQRCQGEHPTLVPNRTIRRWIGGTKRSGEFGVMVEGLFPGHGGNRVPRIPDKLLKLLQALLLRYYLVPGGGETAAWLYYRLRAINDRFRLGVTPSKRTVQRQCKALDPYVKAMIRQGKRYAMRFRPIYPPDWVLGNPNGCTTWQRSHVDSTTADVLNTDGTKKRLYHIKMVESVSAAVLAHCETEEAPSEETARMLITQCVEQHKMLPSTITFDWGPEGKSSWLQMTMEKLGVTVIFRPKATPGSGTNIETMWRKLCQDLLHRLKGSTQLLQKARMVTKAVNPHGHVVWTQAAHRELVDEYYELINDLPRRGRRSPNVVLAEHLAKFGPPPTQMHDIELFRRMLLPFVDDIKRTVSKRGCVRNREHSYYHNDLRVHAGKELVVRHDPRIIKKVWVTLPDNRQLECDVVDTALKYLSEEEAMAYHNGVREDAKKRAEEVETRKAVFVTKVGRIQKGMEAQVRAAQRPPRKRKAPAPAKATPPKVAPESKIIAMPIKFQKVVSS
jgi:hypothetical protein